MNQNSEERLGTAKMLPLVFKMAVPSVIAQLVNLLYSIVDRIYIGHIPQHGTDALAGIGITGSIIILISAFSSLAGGGGAPLAAIALGKTARDIQLFTVIHQRDFVFRVFFSNRILFLTGRFFHNALYLVRLYSRQYFGRLVFFGGNHTVHRALFTEQLRQGARIHSVNSRHVLFR